MTNTNPSEKKQSIWPLAIAISLIVTVFSPQEITAQNTIAQGLLDTIEISWRAAISSNQK